MSQATQFEATQFLLSLLTVLYSMPCGKLDVVSKAALCVCVFPRKSSRTRTDVVVMITERVQHIAMVDCKTTYCIVIKTTIIAFLSIK